MCANSTNRLQHHSTKGHHDTLYGSMMLAFKGNPNFQDIVNWILQILHYYCRKQDKNIKNSRIIQQSLVLSFHFSLFTATCASCCLPQRQNFFISWTKYFTNFKRHKWSFVLYIVSFSGLKMIFTKFSQLDITACIKNCVYKQLQFTLLFHVFNYRTSTNLSFVNTSVQISSLNQKFLEILRPYSEAATGGVL